MNDYPDDSHAAIEAMVRAGDPAQAAEWADRARALGRNLAVASGELRKVIASVPAAWSDGPASGRMIADLTAVADHLELVADLLAGQSASCAGLISDAAATLAAAQGASGSDHGPGDALMGAGRGDIGLGRIDGRIVLLDAARLAAGERATLLDDRYRTVLARLTPPPLIPGAVLGAGGIGNADGRRADPTPVRPRPEAPGATPIGQSGHPDPAASSGIATNPAMGTGALVGGAGDWRQTWLVEDRDLYGTGPSVQPVIGGTASWET